METSYDEREKEAWKIEHQEELKEIDKLRDQGHTHHCACRIVWGDGECECGKITRG